MLLAAKAAAGSAAATAYVNETTPQVAYVAFDLQNNKVGFLVCTREKMDGMWELETFEYASQNKQSKYLTIYPPFFALEVKGDHRLVARQTYKFMPVYTENLEDYVQNAPLREYGGWMDKFNNFKKGTVIARKIVWLDVDNWQDVTPNTFSEETVKRILRCLRMSKKIKNKRKQ